MHVHTVVSSEDASKGGDEVSVKTAGRRTRSRRRKPKAGGGVAEWSCRTAIYRFGARAQPDRWLRLTFTIADSRTRSSSRSLSLSLSRARAEPASLSVEHGASSAFTLPSSPCTPSCRTHTHVRPTRARSFSPFPRRSSPFSRGKRNREGENSPCPTTPACTAGTRFGYAYSHNRTETLPQSFPTRTAGEVEHRNGRRGWTHEIVFPPDSHAPRTHTRFHRFFTEFRGDPAWFFENPRRCCAIAGCMGRVEGEGVESDDWEWGKFKG